MSTVICNVVDFRLSLLPTEFAIVLCDWIKKAGSKVETRRQWFNRKNSIWQKERREDKSTPQTELSNVMQVHYLFCLMDSFTHRSFKKCHLDLFLSLLINFSLIWRSHLHRCRLFCCRLSVLLSSTTALKNPAQKSKCGGSESAERTHSGKWRDTKTKREDGILSASSVNKCFVEWIFVVEFLRQS